MFGVASSNMSEEVSLYDLLNLSIGTPQKSSVNFGALHALLLAVLKQLDLQEIKTRWRGSSPGYGSPDTVGVSAPAEEEEVQPDSELQKRTAPLSAPARGSAAADRLNLLSRIQTCEDGLSKSMRLILDLNKHNEHLKEQMEELRQQHEMAGEVLRTVSLVESCCHRVDVLEETVESLRDAGLPGDRESETEKPFLLQPGDSGVDDQVSSSPSSSDLTKPPQSSPPPSSHPNKLTVGPAAPSSPRTSEEKSQEEPDTTLVQSGPPPQTGVKEDSTAAGKPPTSESNNSKPSPEAVGALRSVNELQERLVQLEARVAALERGKVDQTQLAQLRELITNRGSRGDAFSNLMDQLSEQRALIDGLMSDRGKLDSLEDMLMGLMSPERGSSSEAASEREEAESKGYGGLRYLRKRVQRLEEDALQLKVKHAQCEERASDRQLQDQLDDLRRTLEDTISSFTSQLSTGLKDEAVQGESDSQELQQSAGWSALNARAPNMGEKLSLLFERYEQLQDAVNRLIQQQQSGGRAEPLQDRESVQQVILQLQADCKRLNEATRFLQEDNSEKQRHIEELYKTTEELELNKADKDMVESEIKADKSALEGKVSRLQFDSVTEQLSSLFHELLNKVTNQEQDWHKLMGKLSTEMQCKLNRIELDSVKKQLEDRWRSIHEKLQAQAAPESEDAAGIRKQLVERFHCLSCDRPVVKHTPGPHLVTLPSFPAFPSHKSIRPFTVYTMEQLRQHYRSLQPGTNRSNFQAANLAREQLRRSQAIMCRQIESLETQRRLQHSSSTNAAGVQHERLSELADYSHLAAPRSCSGSHNANAAAVHRRSGPQHTKHHGQCDADGTAQSEGVDIIGLDGRIYKGRLNVRNSETKLPTIPSKDGVCKNKDKVRPAASPEVGHGAPLHQPCSPGSAPCSHSASSCSGRDWPVSALGCASQSSITQSTAEPQSNEPLDL